MTIVQANRGDDIDSVSSGTQDEATNFYSNQSPEGEEKKSVTDEDGTDGSYSKALEDEFGEFMAKAEVELVPKDSERIAATKMFADMRAEGTFCDVTFSVRGILYRAHSVIICAWSRYLRSVILTKEEARGATRMNVQSMDAARISVIEWTLPSIFLDFKPEAFGAVLDYIYGFPIKLTVEVRLKWKTFIISSTHMYSHTHTHTQSIHIYIYRESMNANAIIQYHLP